MASPFGIDVRRSMLNRLKQAARQEPDPRGTIRAQLGPWIAAYGENADSGETEAQIEILEGEGDG